MKMLFLIINIAFAFNWEEHPSPIPNKVATELIDSIPDDKIDLFLNKVGTNLDKDHPIFNLSKHKEKVYHKFYNSKKSKDIIKYIINNHIDLLSSESFSFYDGGKIFAKYINSLDKVETISSHLYEDIFKDTKYKDILSFLITRIEKRDLITEKIKNLINNSMFKEANFIIDHSNNYNSSKIIDFILLKRSQYTNYFNNNKLTKILKSILIHNYIFTEPLAMEFPAELLISSLEVFL